MKRYLIITALVIAMACIFIFGSGFGYMKAKTHFDEYFTSALYASSAVELKGRITLLKLLKNGNYVKAQKRLEALADVDLNTLTLYVNNPPSKPDNEVIEAIRIAKEYRKKYPGHQVNPALKNSVKKTLDFVNSNSTND